MYSLLENDPQCAIPCTCCRTLMDYNVGLSANMEKLNHTSGLLVVVYCLNCFRIVGYFMN